MYLKKSFLMLSANKYFINNGYTGNSYSLHITSIFSKLFFFCSFLHYTLLVLFIQFNLISINKHLFLIFFQAYTVIFYLYHNRLILTYNSYLYYQIINEWYIPLQEPYTITCYLYSKCISIQHIHVYVFCF